MIRRAAHFIMMWQLFISYINHKKQDIVLTPSVSDALEAGTCDLDSVLADPIGSAHYYIIIAFLAVVSPDRFT